MTPSAHRKTKNEKGRNMSKAKAKRRSLERTQKAKRIRPGAPLLETRARSILTTMVGEVTGQPTDLQLPEAPGPVLVEVAEEEVAQSIDDLPTSDLAVIARQGASLEVDGTKHDVVDLVSLAKSVRDDAHLKINNSGTFSAEELGMIARSKPGQVILA